MESGEEIYECVRCGSRDFEIAMRAAEGLGVLVCKQCLLVATLIPTKGLTHVPQATDAP